MKRLLYLVLLAAALSTAPAHAAVRGLSTDRGIIQTVSPIQLVLRSLDGSTLIFSVGSQTVVFVNGQPGAVADLQPGFAATVTHDKQGRAHLIRAVGARRAAREVDKGVVVSVSSTLLVLRTPGDVVVSVRVGPHTVVKIDGQPARLADLRPGDLVAVLHYGTAPASEIRAARRGQNPGR